MNGALFCGPSADSFGSQCSASVMSLDSMTFRCSFVPRFLEKIAHVISARHNSSSLEVEACNNR